MIKTPAFKNWIGNSIAYIGNTEATTFYHKSRSKVKFDEFKHSGKGVIKNQYNNDYGFFFVQENHKHHISYIGDGIDVLAYLRMEKPFYIGDDGNGNIVDEDGKKYDALYIPKEFAESILARGFDSIIIFCEKYYHQFIVFNPNQIKSIDNNGEFSTESNNIFK